MKVAESVSVRQWGGIAGPRFFAPVGPRQHCPNKAVTAQCSTRERSVSVNGRAPRELAPRALAPAPPGP
eukprot:2195384-Pyramimonas_sp.AAC.1